MEIKKIFLFILLFTHLYVFGEKIEGTIKNLPDGKVYLTNRGFASGVSYVRLVYDSCIANENGFFSFNLKAIDESKIYSIEFKSPEIGWIPLLIRRNEHIVIKGVINKTRKIESITGSSEYLLMQDIGNKTKGYIRKLNMFADSSAFFYETNPDSSRHYTRLNKIYSDSIRYAEIEFIKVNSHSTYSLHLLNSYLFSIKKDSVKKILSNFDHTIRKLNLFKQIDEYVMTETALVLFQYPPTVSVTNIKGKKNQLALGNTNNKILLIDLWASWCRPCRENIPRLKVLSDSLRFEKFEIKGISIDADRSRWIKAIEQERLPWNNYLIPANENNKIKSLLNIESIPKYILISKEGKVICISSDLMEIERKLYEIL